ncbi:hypothetical protein TCAL_05165 [Tigriopus californicus]|uniref:Apyrase n=1 Tax=Tigriopus californicus TaxID=6832 RepID=A0A553NQT9_TIGCA|nr:hypothetical protein TCAL_05165 [Tigriopus californicus]|eukprot:TCALIF_05165-PA protein Name:"Similar to ENTPD1 Ectonucleoside triphosphate diphosphohydrolase 1 (Bos taurus)" AED:0.13 eAED:0.15 QI:0/0/0/1/1/1/2/0/327
MNQRRFVVGALVAVVALIIMTLDFTFKDTSNTGQVIVINAGSRQTTALLYQWNLDLEGDCVREMERLYHPNISLASFEGNLTGLTNFMQGLLTEIERWDLSSSHIPIYFGATAGMRALNESNPDQADEILKLIKRVIEDSPFKEGKVEILSGEEEAHYGWLTVNLLVGAIPESQSSECGMESIQTSGAMDMGGGSLEVAFESGEDSDERLRLFNRTFLIRSDMSNCYGINWATRRFLALNVFRHYQGGNNLSGALIPNPCANEHCQGFQDSNPLGTNKMDIFGKNGFSCTQFRDRGFSAVLDPIPDNFTFQFDGFYDKQKKYLNKIA